jgi:cytochrome c553
MSAALLVALLIASCGHPQPDTPPLWAYPLNSTPQARWAVDVNAPLHLDGSTAAYTRKDLGNLFAVPDWRPEAHPPMPAVVAAGRRPDVMACAFCHLATGDGRAENTSLAGLPKAYIIAQMAHFKDGSRVSTVAGRGPPLSMIKIAKAATDAEVEAAASYFASLKRRSYVTVVETTTIPQVVQTAWVYRKAPQGGQEPLGQRVIETPDDFDLFETRDPDVRWTAFVPPGSIDKGARIASHWGPLNAFACASCHGAGLRGAAAAPPLAGRSPTYIVRQLYDFQTGARQGAAAAPMQAVVKSMRTADMIALAAYIGSLRP